MKERKKIFLTVVVVSLLLFCGVHSLGAREAPVFQLPGLDGEIYSLSDFRGEPVVISFSLPGVRPVVRSFLFYKIYEEYEEKPC